MGTISWPSVGLSTWPCTYIEDYAGTDAPVPLLKLHGTIDRPDTVVITSNVIAEGLSVPKAQALKDLAKMASSLMGGTLAPWVYVGCSMRDKDINPVIGLREFAASVNESWVAPFITPTVGQFIEEHRTAYGVDGLEKRTITQTADVFFETLADSW